MFVRSIALVVVLVLLGSCQPQHPIRVGYLAGLSGPSSALGTGARKALEMDVKKLNQSGGIAGRAVELVVEDEGDDPEQALRAFDSLAKAGTRAIIGPMASTQMGTLLPEINAKKIVTISPTVSAASVSGKEDWFFRVIVESSAMGTFFGPARSFTRLSQDCRFA